MMRTEYRLFLTYDDIVRLHGAITTGNYCHGSSVEIDALVNYCEVAIVEKERKSEQLSLPGMRRIDGAIYYSSEWL